MNGRVLESLSKAISAVGHSDFIKKAVCYLKDCLEFDNVIVIVFDKRSRPVVLYRQASAGDVFRFVDSQYLSGAYLLDPIYHLHLDGGQLGLYRLTDIAPDHFRRSHYFNLYYGQMNISDEISVVIPLGDLRTLTISMGIEGNMTRIFSAKAENELRQHEPVIMSLLGLHWARDSGPATKDGECLSTPNRLISLLHEKTRIKLSGRQAEIALFILQGHSSLSIGLKLEISTQTVKVFRKQLYRKLNISSQAELFALMIPLLQRQPTSL